MCGICGSASFCMCHTSVRRTSGSFFAKYAWSKTTMGRFSEAQSTPGPRPSSPWQPAQKRE